MKIKNVLPKSHYKLQSRNSTHHHNQPCSSRSPPSELPFVQPPILTDAALLAAVGRAQLPADQSTTSGKEKGNTCKMMKPRRTRGHLRLLLQVLPLAYEQQVPLPVRLDCPMQRKTFTFILHRPAKREIVINSWSSGDGEYYVESS